MQGTALQACVGKVGGFGIGQKRNTQVKRLLNRFSSLPQSAFFSVVVFFFSTSTNFKMAGSPDWNRTQNEAVSCCCESLLPFTRAPSGAYRIVVWPVQSEKARQRKRYFLLASRATTEKAQDTLNPHQIIRARIAIDHKPWHRKVTLSSTRDKQKLVKEMIPHSFTDLWST